MTFNDLIAISQWLFLFYFIGINGGYLALNLVSIFTIFPYMAGQSVARLPGVAAQLLPPVTVIIPAFNEAATIVGSVRAILQLDYPEFEVLIVNDGSADDTLQALIDAFHLKEFPEAYRARLQTKPIHRIFASTRLGKVRVIDKENGGKADAINAGINAARYPLYCCIDADSILQRDSLMQVVQPFILDSRTVASGGTVRVVNGCKVEDGYLVEVGAPHNLLPTIQVVEYMRAFLFGRLGWSPLNALLIVSGAFGVFHKETVIAAGGYRTDTVGEDMELVVRLHRLLRQRGKDYRITFVPDPVCWTEVPDNLRALSRQRIRWQRGLAESLFMNLRLLCHWRGGMVGWVAFPFMLLFEWLGPFIEVFGLVLIITGFIAGVVAWQTFWMLMGVAIGFSLLLSVTALFLEEISFHVYKRPRDLLRFLLAIIVENLGYRQLTVVWRIIGMWQWFFNTRQEWGVMQRSSRWG